MERLRRVGGDVLRESDVSSSHGLHFGGDGASWPDDLIAPPPSRATIAPLIDDVLKQFHSVSIDSIDIFCRCISEKTMKSGTFRTTLLKLGKVSQSFNHEAE